MPGGHFYTIDPKGELAPSSGYTYEGITGYVYTSHTPIRHDAAPSDVVTDIFATACEVSRIYRWYHPSSGDHFYTADEGGEEAPKNGYKSEGTAWYMFERPKTGTVPLCCWFSPRNGDHFYTTNPKGRLAPTSGYIFEGITGYLHPSSVKETVPLFHWSLR